MIEAHFSINNEFNADIVNFLGNSIFAFDFKEKTFWISDILESASKKLLINLPKDSFSMYKISLCKNLPLLAHIDESETNVVVIDTQLAKIIGTFKIQDSKIECISINDKGDTLIIGGKNGVVSRWDIYSGKLLDIPNRHKDFVLSAKESSNKRFVVSISYDRSVILFDKYKDKNGVFVCNTNNTIKCVEFFDECRFLALGDISGFVYIINTNTKFVIHRFQVAFSSIVAIAHYKDAYLFCLNENGGISVVNYNTQEKILESFLPQNRYKAMIIHGDLIILSTQDKKIIAYSFKALLEYGESLLANDDIIGVYNFISEYKFLQSEDFYIEVEMKFEADVLESIALACSNNQNMALQILHKYTEIPAKKKEITNLITDIRGINEFLKLMEAHLEIRAIPLVAKNPILKELKSYLEFENRFSRVLMLAKELVKKGKKSDANTVMMQYKKIPTKIRSIQEVISYPEKVDDALLAIKTRDYKTFFRLKKDYQFVNSLQDVKDILQDGGKYYFKLLEAFYELDLESCRQYISILKNFQEYKDFVIEIEFKINEIANLVDIMRDEI